jgi:membrane protein implicated in regulation of membrane protease activity
MLLLIAVLLLVFVLSPAVGIVVVAIALFLEIGELAFWRKWMRDRRAQTGSEAMPGELAEVVEPVGNDRGTVRLRGESWRARSPRPIAAGERVRVAQVEGLTLTVEPVAGAEAIPGTEKGP